jgi:hypothetical protein
VFGYILGDFPPNSSGHPAPCHSTQNGRFCAAFHWFIFPNNGEQRAGNVLGSLAKPGIVTEFQFAAAL